MESHLLDASIFLEEIMKSDAERLYDYIAQNPGNFIPVLPPMPASPTLCIMPMADADEEAAWDEVVKLQNPAQSAIR